MENMNNFDLDEVLDPAEQVMMDTNFARTKGFLLGAAVVGASWGATHLIKKFRKKRKAVVEVIEPEEEEEEV